MTLTLDTASVTESIELDEYLDFVRGVSFNDEDAIIESGSALKALANNRSMLVDWINDHLRRAVAVPGNGYGGHTLSVAVDDDYMVRVNFWLPPDPASPNPQYDAAYFSYDLPHDHDFSFLTVGYCGPGYGTEIYEYDPAKVVGYPGERVDMTFLEDTTLDEGKVMFYRESRDIHTQRPPDQFSVSVNLLSRVRLGQQHCQYLFDLEESTIHRLGTGYRHNGSTVCHLAALVGDDSTIAPLEDLANSEVSPFTRWQAIQALIALDPDNAPARLAERLDNELSPYVSHNLREALSVR